MRIFLTVCLLVACAGVFQAHGEYYRYLDKDGVVCFTDDPAQIPDDQREKSDVFKEAPRQVNETDTGAVPEASMPGADISASDADFQKLKQLSSELETEYLVLKSEREQLLQAEKEKMSEAESTAHNAKVMELNKRTKAYMQRKEAYAKQVKSYYKSKD